MKNYREFKVKVPNIEGVSNAYWKQYIEDAVSSWCGQAVRPPDHEFDEMWALVESNRMDAVKVTSLRGGKKTLLESPVDGKSGVGT